MNNYKFIMSSVLLLSTLQANAMSINAKDAQVDIGKNTMTLKRVHVDNKDYILNMKWNSYSNSWQMINYEPDYGYGWRTHANMSDPVDWAGSAVWANRFYVIGGGTQWNTIRVYNPIDNTWTDNVVDDIGFILRAAALSGNIYIFDTSDTGKKSWKYSINTNKLSPLSIDLPNLAWTSEAAIHNGKIYFFGGEDQVNNGALSTTWEFDPVKLIFTEKSNMPTAGYGASTAVLDGKIYVIGGNYRNDKIEIYNPKTNKWEFSLSYPELSLSGWDTATALNGKIVIASADKNGATFVFDPVTQTLIPQDPMLIPHGSYLTGEGLDDRLYVAGGSIGGYKLDSFKPNLATSKNFKQPLAKMKSLTTQEPDYVAIEKMHKSRIEQIQNEINIMKK